MSIGVVTVNMEIGSEFTHSAPTTTNPDSNAHLTQ